MTTFSKHSLFTAGALLLAVLHSSCARMEADAKPTVPPFRMKVSTGAPSKTLVNEVSAEEYSLSWLSGDAVGLYEVANGVIQDKAESAPLTAASSTASFTLELAGAASAPYDYTFVYPASALSRTGETCYVTLPGEQTFAAASFDMEADVLLSRHQHYATERPASLTTQFARLGATARMVIKAPSTSERIERIDFSTTEGNLHGSFTLDPATGALSGGITDGGGKKLRLYPAQATTFTGNIVVWFRLAAITLSQDFTVKVRTESHTYVKTSDLASASRTLEFTNGGLTKFNVNMTAVEALDNDFEGSYAEFTVADAQARKLPNGYTEMTKFAKSYGDAWSGYISCESTCFRIKNGSDPVCFLKLPDFSEEIDHVEVTLSTVTTGRKLYLSATSDAELKDAYAQASTADGVLSYTLDVSSLHLNTAYLRVTSGSIPLAKVAVITKADSRSAIAAPTDITAALDAKVNNVVHLNWACVDDAASYLIAYTPSGGSASTVQVASDGAQAQSYTLEGLSYGTSYSFTVTARPDPYFCLDSAPASADKSVTTGAQPSGLKVDYIDVSMTDATTTTYVDWSGKSYSGGSSAVYAGKSAKGNSVIQLNASNPYGIWSTTSGGYVRSVTITVNSGTSRTVDVYAKNEAYASGNLYGTAANKGTKVGSVTNAASGDPTPQKVTFSGSYTHVGIRSNSGALYIPQIRIEWATTPPSSAAATTSAAADVEVSQAVLNGSYSDATGGIVEAGFYWDTSSLASSISHEDQKVVACGESASASGSFSCTLSALNDSQKYYFRAYIVEYDSSTQTYSTKLASGQQYFTTLSRSAYTPGGWLEMPSYSTAAMAGTTPSALDDLYSVTHYVDTLRNSVTVKARNYSILYDPAMYTSYWVAYPLAKGHMGAGRDEDWGFDPSVPQSKQTTVKKSYGVNVASTSYDSQHYARGHQQPNADRNGNDEMMAQTYFSTNMTPQLQNGFNGGIWLRLEDGVRECVTAGPTQKDTVYVVTGAAFRKKGGSETIKYITNRDNKSLPVPNYYWKVLLKVKWNAGQVAGACAIGVWLEHRDNYVNASKANSFLPYVTTVDQIEAWTGFDFFANLSEALQTTCEANNDWATFRDY